MRAVFSLKAKVQLRSCSQMIFKDRVISDSFFSLTQAKPCS